MPDHARGRTVALLTEEALRAARASFVAEVADVREAGARTLVHHLARQGRDELVEAVWSALVAAPRVGARDRELAEAVVDGLVGADGARATDHEGEEPTMTRGTRGGLRAWLRQRRARARASSLSCQFGWHQDCRGLDRDGGECRCGCHAASMTAHGASTGDGQCRACGNLPPRSELHDNAGDPLCQQCVEPEALPGYVCPDCRVSPCVCDWVPSYD